VESALYFGTVRHRRFAPRAHRLAYPIFQLYADLDELDALFAGSWLASTRRPAWAWLRRSDHFGAVDRPWPDAVRDLVEARLGRRPRGGVRLLTHPRTLGFRMNPVSFFYCFDPDGALEAIVAEVTNTPWDERHLYVLDARRDTRQSGHRPTEDRPAGDRPAGARPIVEARFAKELHVSPFFPMEIDYRWRFTPPGERLAVQMENHRAGAKQFDATLRLERRPLTPSNLRRALVGYPALTLRVYLWIHLHAALLALKGVPFHAHPKHRLSSLPGPAAAPPPASRAGSSSAV
jgi:DUF1365 family protein